MIRIDIIIQLLYVRFYSGYVILPPRGLPWEMASYRFAADAAGGVGESSTGRQLTKWQTALLLGVPLAALSVAGVALFLYLRRRRGVERHPLAPTIEVGSQEKNGSATPVPPVVNGGEQEEPEAEALPAEPVRCRLVGRASGRLVGINYGYLPTSV